MPSSCKAAELVWNGPELICRCSDFLLLGLQCGSCLGLLLRQLQQAVYELQGLQAWSSNPAKFVPKAAKTQPWSMDEQTGYRQTKHPVQYEHGATENMLRPVPAAQSAARAQRSWR